MLIVKCCEVMLYTHKTNQINEELIGQTVTVCGWVNVRRDHGKLIFIDLRDAKGIVQVVFTPENKDAHEQAAKLRAEFCVCIAGIVSERPKGMENSKLPSGMVEIAANKLTILNEAKTPPFEVDQDTKKVSEEVRLSYRYLDLRSERMHEHLAIRSKIAQFVRNFLISKDFIEVETPYITKGTPEGAREYVVPSRLHHGLFYTLPQAPQQFKQLLMVAGMEKYFQLVRCFRDEDPRGDRQPEFTQIDIEMSFGNQEDILALWEEAVAKLVKDLFPDKKITQTPWPRIDYDEAIKTYKTDRPDLRVNKDDPNELAFCWVVNFPLFEFSDTEKKLVPSHHPFTAPKDSDIDLLSTKPADAKADQYDFAFNGFEVGSGSIRIHKREIQEKIFSVLGLSPQEVN